MKDWRHSRLPESVSPFQFSHVTIEDYNIAIVYPIRFQHSSGTFLHSRSQWNVRYQLWENGFQMFIRIINVFTFFVKYLQWRSQGLLGWASCPP